jgi:hypothetical protein
MKDMPLESVRDLFASLVGYLPTLVAGLLVLLLGLVVGWVGNKIVVRLLILLRLDRVASRLGWGRAFEKGDVRHSLFEMVGTLFGVMIFVIFLDSAVDIWKLSMLSRLLERAVLLVPQFFTALIILLIGSGVAAAVSRAVQRALHQEQFSRAQFVARLVRATILLVTVAIVLVQLKIAVAIVTGAFLITIGALAVSLALAFGLGSRRAVEMMWEERFRRRDEERKKDAE